MELSKYIDKIYDYQGNKKAHNKWERYMRRVLRNKNYEIDFSDSGWYYVD